MTNWEHYWSWSLITTGEVAEELNASHPMVIWHLNQIGKVKKLDKWVSHELTKIPKNCRFEGSSSLILWNNNKPFFNQIMTYDKKRFLYDKQWWPSQWLDQEGQSTSQSQTPTQKRSRLLFGGLLSIWSTTAFWILAKPLHLRSMFGKSMRHTEKCNAYSWQWSTERAQFLSTTLPDHTSHNQHFKVEWIGLHSFVSFTKFTWPLANRLLLFQASRKLFAGKMLPQPAGGRKCFPRVHRILRYRFLHYRNKQIYFSLVKMCWL